MNIYYIVKYKNWQTGNWYDLVSDDQFADRLNFKSIEDAKNGALEQLGMGMEILIIKITEQFEDCGLFTV